MVRPATINPERLGWTVLLSAFFVLVFIVSGGIFGSQWWFSHAKRSQGISLVPSGTVLVTEPDSPLALVNLTTVPVGAKIATDATGQASVNFTSPDGQHVLASVRMFPNSEIEVRQAESPRYARGLGPHRIVLYLTSGRIRATMGIDLDREVRIDIQSEPGVVTTLTMPGSNVSLESTRTDTMITVRDGNAIVTANAGSLVLNPDERSVVSPGQPPSGPLTGEQNWILNGDFAEPFDGTWTPIYAQPQDPNELTGQVDIIPLGGRRVVRFFRQGRNWGRVSIVEQINRDVQGYSSLRLNLDVQLAAQDLPNCGLQGTECPLTVKINYVDIVGDTREWLQGFYSFYDSDPNRGLTYCLTCPVRFVHQQWPLGKWQAYSSENLLEVFAAAGTPAARIQSITIYAEGHSFSSLVTDVQLLASE